MGPCISSNSGSQHQLSALKEREVKLLQLLYVDLASRDRQNALTQQNFSIFFHLSGLWSECVYKRFDTESRGILDFAQFRKGIEKLSKGSFDSQIEVLFSFYASENNTISYKQLLKMLYSYPKEQLKDMLNDDSFLTGLDVKERRYYFGKNAKLDDNRIVVEEAEDQSEQGSKNQLPLQQVDMNHVATMKDFALDVKSKKSEKTQGQRRFSESFRHLPFLCSKSKVKLTCNISVVVKKFATHLFKEFGLDKDKGRLCYDQFKTLIKKHTKIFTQYFEGFHLYIWECDQKQKPNFKNSTSWYESAAQQIDLKENQSTKRYLNYMKNTLLIFKDKEDVMPVQIKNLQGLQVESYKSGDKVGILIKHRDGIYPQKAYCFESVPIQNEWLRHLKQFCGTGSIQENFRLQEKIGAGNFSVVYKALDKQSNVYVAIKVIEKFKLSVAEKEVLKNECSILELCHHPRIANFIKKVQTKTSLYIITELMKQGDLADYVKKKGFLEEYEASLILKQIIQTMMYLKSLGIIHRDLKPENVMIKLKKDKQQVQGIKIIDFGFAIFKDSLANLKGKERFVGTPNYVAPQILLQEDYDERVDNFSIGVILYFMLDGKLPFDSLFNEEIYQSTIECRYQTDNVHWMNVSKGAKDLLSRLLTTKTKRISLTQASKHPWIKEGQDLKACAGKNKRDRYI